MSTETATKAPARLDLTQPRRLTTAAVFVLSAYGLVLAVPVLLSMMWISVRQFDGWTFAVPLLTLAIASFFLPVGFGNPYVKRLVCSHRPDAGKDEDGFVVQVTLNPRVHWGLRALVEDADDFGYLRFTETGLVLEGDSINGSIPFDQIQQVQRRSIGWRGLFLCKQRIALVVPGLPEVESLEFAERASWTLPAARSAARKLHERLAAALKRTS
jgi:hypothetical protein